MLNFKILYLISVVIGVVIVALNVTWVLNYMGVVWDVSHKNLYNWHSICMVLGMVFFFGNCELFFVFQGQW
jgi:hypothetical protein